MRIQKTFTRPEGLDVPEAPLIEQLHHAMKYGLIVEAGVSRVTELNGSPTWEIELDGYRGFVPFEESGLEHKGQMNQYPGTKIYCKVRGIDASSGVVALSRKDALVDLRKQALENLRAGQEKVGVVKGVGRDVAYVDIAPGLTAELPRQEATFSQLAGSLRRIFSIGDVVRVKVVEVDKEKGYVRVSRTALLPDPWERVDYKRGDTVPGVVVGIKRKGDRQHVFVEVKEGVVGLMNLPMNEKLRPGDWVQATVNKFSKSDGERRLRLRFKTKLS